jgi:hypothetical protein
MVKRRNSDLPMAKLTHLVIAKDLLMEMRMVT